MCGGYVLLGDFNTKSPLWGSPIPDNRGIYLAETAVTLDLVMLNDGKKVTFI